MARFLFATVLLAVCVSYASAAWGGWRQKYPEGSCYCGNGVSGSEMWTRECYGADCPTYPTPVEEESRPCSCESVLTPGEIAGIVVGAVVFLILIIILIIWCVYCGCDCGCDEGRGPRRWGSDDDIYRGKVIQAQPPTVVAGPHMHAPFVQAYQPAPVTYALPAQKPVTFATSVVQQPQMVQAPMIQQPGVIYAKQQTPTIQYLS